MSESFDIVADLDTPVSAYLKMAPFRPRFLLESVEGGDRLGRYSFIGFGDGLHLSIGSDHITIGENRQARPPDTSALLDVMRQALHAAPVPAPALPSVPFTGGLVGYTSYEMNRQFDGPRTPAPTGDTQTLAAFFAPRSVLVFDHLTRRAALIHAGSEGDRQDLRSEIIKTLRGPLPPRPISTPHLPPTQSMSRDRFEQRVAEAKERIAEGDIFQVVLSVCFEGECDVPPFEVYRALRLLNPSPYLYYLDFDEVKVVGSSPEALVRLNGREASLRPIAGTRPRGGNSKEDLAYEHDLINDPKELAEHVMLVDLARNDLGRVAVAGSIAVDPFKIVERYSHVMHIVSGVRGVLKPGADAFDLFAASFPAGTVSGAPKISAMEIVESMEPQTRGIYAGTVGYFGNTGSMDQAIAIRTLTFRNGRYAYQAGAGIVADSIPSREFEEVIAKSAALEAALTNAEAGL